MRETGLFLQRRGNTASGTGIASTFGESRYGCVSHAISAIDSRWSKTDKQVELKETQEPVFLITADRLRSNYAGRKPF